MGRAKKTRQFATMKRMISLSDPRLKEKDRAPPKKKKPEDPNEIKTTEAPQTSSALFFQYNTALGPPFHILLDTSKRINSKTHFSCSNYFFLLIFFYIFLFRFHKFFYQEQNGHFNIYDGLLVCQVHSLHHRLCHG